MTGVGSGVTSEPWRRRWDAAVMNTYGTPELVLASGSGTRVVDVGGRTYLDLVGGIAVNVLQRLEEKRP